jgi:hypothetical protein
MPSIDQKKEYKMPFKGKQDKTHIKEKNQHKIQAMN